uniref:Vacuolar protein-sorting-associated protein 25 n=1 Tax=Petromyzon marinus TaxID=7757 RepID=S4R6R2_PETMA
ADMSFSFPWQHRFPPFYTLQPNADTRQKQLSAWCSLVLDYCRAERIFTMDVLEVQDSALFHNKTIHRIAGKLSLEMINIIMDELRKRGSVEWQDKTRTRCLIMWRRPEEWGKLIHQWVMKSGMSNTVCTLYELTHGEDTAREEFHGLDEWLLLRALESLQEEGRAEVMSIGDGKGVKFF